jgi:hypothetical protein
MRIKSGDTSKYIYFMAKDDTTGAAKTGLSSFTVYRSRNGAANAAYTTPTINETDVTNSPGLYEMLVDEDTTVDAGNYSEAYVLTIKATGMENVFREIELFDDQIIQAAAVTGTLSSTQMSTNLTEATDDHYIGRRIVWTSGALRGEARTITDYVGSTKVLTYATATDTPSNGDKFVIV